MDATFKKWDEDPKMIILIQKQPQSSKYRSLSKHAAVIIEEYPPRLG